MTSARQADKLLSFLGNGESRTILFLSLSALSLLISFIAPAWFPVDAAGLPALPVWLPLDTAWLAILLCGIPIVKGALVGLIREFDIKADMLVSIALIASIIIGEVFAAGEIAFIMTIGSFLEERTVAKARAGIEKLIHLSPTTARVVLQGEERILPAEQVKVGDILRVLAGETIAVDGVIIKGQTSVDQSVMTGESLPVDKGEGDEVQSGTVNQFGTFDMQAQKVGEDSSLQRMIRLVETADAGKAKIVSLADRWATWIVVIALVSSIVTWFVTGEIIRSVTILVVFCPCALVLATPTAIMAGIGNATKYGILVNQGDALERLAKVRRIAFDKTGTLTFGKPSVTKVEACAPGVSAEQLLALTATAEMRSEHPLGKAIVAHYQQQAGALPAEPESFCLLPGRGVEALAQGLALLAGNEALLADHAVQLPSQLQQSAQESKADGCTVIYVMRQREGVEVVLGQGVCSGVLKREGVDAIETVETVEVIGLIALSDALRPDAAQTVSSVHATGTQTVLLTGDSPQAARHIARVAGITAVQANCLPKDKLTLIQQYQQEGEPICMVGDGINDAPALKAAQVGIAMGGIGSDIAIEAADIVLVSDDIKQIPHLLLLAKKVMRTIKINLSASMLLNFVAIVLAITGILNPVT
ncbi:MAG: cation-translocating P-type ATPase, partial [Coriobacteriales bacterium]|nr:cation-translocating P-type ATPase [Coriobacteriales bacterium]